MRIAASPLVFAFGKCVIVRIAQERQFFSVSRLRCKIETDRRNSRLPAKLDNRLATVLADSAIANIPVTIAVLADAVDPNDIALILNCPGPQQAAPVLAPLVRPAGHENQQVVLATIATPGGKPQVVTNLRADPPAAVGNHHS